MTVSTNTIVVSTAANTTTAWCWRTRSGYSFFHCQTFSFCCWQRSPSSCCWRLPHGAEGPLLLPYQKLLMLMRIPILELNALCLFLLKQQKVTITLANNRLGSRVRLERNSRLLGSNPSFSKDKSWWSLCDSLPAKNLGHVGLTFLHCFYSSQMKQYWVHSAPMDRAIPALPAPLQYGKWPKISVLLLCLFTVAKLYKKVQNYKKYKQVLKVQYVQEVFFY